MRLFLLAALLVFNCLPALADVLSPEVAGAQERLNANPDTYDRVDELCKGRDLHAGCTIPGTTFSGGGAGTCETTFNREGVSLDRICVRSGEVWIDRKLPEGGFVNDAGLCGRDTRRSGENWNCKAMSPTPADQFCTGKKPGDTCTVELTYLGKTEHHDGSCAEVTESEHFYYQGHRTSTRQVIRCEPPPAAARTFSNASWWQKLHP